MFALASVSGPLLGGFFTMRIAVLAVQNAVACQDLRTATSATVFFRLLGGLLGTALFDTVPLSRLQHKLAPDRGCRRPLGAGPAAVGRPRCGRPG